MQHIIIDTLMDITYTMQIHIIIIMTHIIIDGGHVCTRCGKIYGSESGLREHTRREHEERGLRYHCNVCEKQFMSRANWRSHERNHLKVDMSCDRSERQVLEGYMGLGYSIN